jgi:glycosyltransferase involved in cell wall biosynthesis
MKLSIIVPTRGRRRQLRALLESLADCAADPGRVEVVLVADADDPDSYDVREGRLTQRLIVVPPGLPMGSLNMHGCRAATGDGLMLCNDDVIVRTRGWDARIEGVFRSFPDGMVLTHVDDGTFHERLCTFPCVSRAFVDLAGGICPEGYRRYRIDDHIYNVFNLLARLGEFRIQYLADVLFEHHNYAEAGGRRVYVPDPMIHDQDTRLYRETFAARKALAVRLKERIRARRDASHTDLFRANLERFLDPLDLRLPGDVRHAAESRPLNSDNTRLTVGVVSADVRSSHARRCLSDLKHHTRNFDLVILDNGRSGEFNHAREMNRLITMARTDYLVLMDDDVFVEPGWADALLACIDSRVGVVTPVHYDAWGRFSYAGVIMHGDRSGRHRHDLNEPVAPLRIMTMCSALMLIDLPKCGHLRLDENYSKFFLDVDYGLSVWEAGYQVLCTPHAAVTHVGGATLWQGPRQAHALHEPQRQYFVQKWIGTGRYDALESGIWAGIPELDRLRREHAVEEPLPVVESYRAHRVVFHDGAWFGISEGYPLLTGSRLEQGFYRRGVVGATREDVKRALDRMPYPQLLQHARIALDGGRKIRHGVRARARGVGHRVLRALGFPRRRIGRKGARLLVRILRRLGWPGAVVPTHPSKG